MDSDCSIESVVDRASDDVGAGYVLEHVEVNRVPAKYVGLPCVSYFDVLNPPNCSELVRAKEHDVRAMLLIFTALRTLYNYIPGQQSNLSPHVNRFAPICLCVSEMLVSGRSVKCDSSAYNVVDGEDLGFCVVK